MFYMRVSNLDSNYFIDSRFATDELLTKHSLIPVCYLSKEGVTRVGYLHKNLSKSGNVINEIDSIKTVSELKELGFIEGGVNL